MSEELDIFKEDSMYKELSPSSTEIVENENENNKVGIPLVLPHEQVGLS